MDVLTKTQYAAGGCGQQTLKKSRSVVKGLYPHIVNESPR